MPLSYSQLNTYRICPRQYEFQVIKKLPHGISQAESFGSSVHNCLKKFGELEMSGQSSVASDQLAMFQQSAATDTDHLLLTTDHLRDLWHQSFILDTYSTRLEADFHRERGMQLLQHFFQWWSREPRHVLAVEQSFKIPIDGVLLSGRMDRVEEVRGQGSGLPAVQSGIRVIDFKTSPPRSQNEADADLQLSIYALAIQELYDMPCTELILLYLNDDQVVERTTSRLAGQLADAQKQIMHLKERMDEQDFHPTPGKSVCSRCPYRGICDVAAVS
ncbi:MAG: PD-(D/E)XK nuclease family protein [Candidatus Peribacteraceae bacterium]